MIEEISPSWPVMVEVYDWPVVAVITHDPELPLFIGTDYDPASLAEITERQELELIELQLHHALETVRKAQNIHINSGVDI